MYLMNAAKPVGYIMDAVILVGLLVFVAICAKRGFVTVFFNFFSSIVALFVAISLAKVFVSMTGGLFGLEASLAEKFSETLSKIQGFDVDLTGAFTKEYLTEQLSTGKLPAIIVTLVAKKYVGVELAAGTTLGMLAGDTIAELLCSLISGIVLFIVLKILIMLLKKVFNLLADKINLLGKINHLLGSLVGLIEGVLVISIILSILALIPSAALTNFFNSSFVLRFLYNHNPIVMMLGWFL